MTETDTETARCRRKSEKIMKEKPRDRETTKTEREREREREQMGQQKSGARSGIASGRTQQASGLGEHSRPAASKKLLKFRMHAEVYFVKCLFDLQHALSAFCSIQHSLSAFVGIIQHSLSALWSHASRNSNSVFKTQATRRVLICGGVNKCC